MWLVKKRVDLPSLIRSEQLLQTLIKSISISLSMMTFVSSRICCGPNAASGFYLIVRHINAQQTNITDQNLALLQVVVLE